MHIEIKNGKTIELPEGSTGKTLAEQLHLHGPDQALAISINGVLCDLTAPLSSGDEVTLLHFSDDKGREVFWHTSAHVLAQAVLRLWPDALPTIGPPIQSGFYYDFANLKITEEDLPRIEKEMRAIVEENYLSQREVFSNKEEALQAFGKNPYKRELIESFSSEQSLSGYRQGDFFDLCRGPHLPNLGKIKALKVMKTSGAYWHGDAKNEMLTRIYGITFPDRKQLKEYLERLEEAKKRDHKVLGPKLDLFSLKEEAPGIPFIHPKGLTIWNTLVDYLRVLMKKYRYVEIKTPNLLIKELWECSGHWSHYREHMFTYETEHREFALKPMNCPGCMLFYKSSVRSYRDLPYRVAEIGHVHRNEPSGALSGLLRVLSFHQDDAHIFMKPEDIEREIAQAIAMAEELYTTFGLSFHLELSTRPVSGTIGTDEEWDLATRGLRSALEKSGREFHINEGDGAFYGPKIDFHILDAIGRSWQCGTIQLDMALPEKFALEYTAIDGTRQRPVMIHRALCGSLERFFGILIEHFAGRFPLWCSPEAVRILIVADRHESYAQEVLDVITQAGFPATMDKSPESVGKKVRNAQINQINYILTVGDQEQEHRTVALRTRDNVVHGEIALDVFLKALKQEREERSLVSPFMKK